MKTVKKTTHIDQHGTPLEIGDLIEGDLPEYGPGIVVGFEDEDPANYEGHRGVSVWAVHSFAAPDASERTIWHFTRIKKLQ